MADRTLSHELRRVRTRPGGRKWPCSNYLREGATPRKVATMLRRQSDPNQGTSIVRFRFALAVMVAGMLFAAGIASAQSTTQTSTDESLSGYSKTTTTKTQAVAPTSTAAPAAEGQEENSVAPS